MVPLSRRAIPLAAFALLVFATAGAGQHANQFPNVFPGLPNPTSKYPVLDYQLRLAFDRMDQNKDTILDKDELAKAFRGPTAKAAPPVYDDQGRVNPEASQAATKYHDLIYLMTLDKDGDGQISWIEYRTYYETIYAQNMAAARVPVQAVNYTPRRSSSYYRSVGPSYSHSYHNARRYSHTQRRDYTSSGYSLQQRQQQYVQQVLRAQQNQARMYAQNLAHLQQQRQQYMQRILAQRQQAYRQQVNNMHHHQQQRARTTHPVRRR